MYAIRSYYDKPIEEARTSVPVFDEDAESKDEE